MDVASRSVRARKVRESGGGVVQQLYFVSKLFGLYEIEHANTLNAFELLQGRFNEFFDASPNLVLTLSRGYIFVNDIRIRLDKAQKTAVDWFVERLFESGIKSVTFKNGLKVIELKKFIPHMATAVWREDQEHPPDIQTKLAEEFVQHVVVRMRKLRDPDAREDEDEDEETSVEARKLAAALYAKVRATVGQLLIMVRRNEPVNLKETKLIIQLVTDFLWDDPVTLLSLVAMKPVEAGEKYYLPSHIAHVAIYSMAIGIQIGLAKKQLLDLGCASMVFDLGMVRVPEEFRSFEEGLDPDARESIRLHPTWAAESVLGGTEQSSAAFSAAMVAACHHRGGPYPTCVPGEADLFSDIVTVADAYDALTTWRPWRRNLRPDEALRTLMEAEEGYDKTIVKTFANIVGVYPSGTLVELSTGEAAIVERQGGQEDRRTLTAKQTLTRPRVKLVLDADGMNMEGMIVSLEERDWSGAYKRSITKVLDMEELEMGIGDMLALI
ncbi:HD-GYP domain-containing protein [Planctomycetota bacterium]